MYVRSVEVRDLRAIRPARVELLYPGRRRGEGGFDDVAKWPPGLSNVTVFLGNNGSGNTPGCPSATPPRSPG